MRVTGILYPQDTFNGFHKIGFNVFLSAFAVLVIHGTFSYPSQVLMQLPSQACYAEEVISLLLTYGACFHAFIAVGCLQDGWFPDPFFSVKINNIHKCKHGSDSESYDTEGRFVPVHILL